MGCDGVGDISAGVGGMVNGPCLTSRSIARSGASGGGSTERGDVKVTVCLIVL